MKIKNIKSFLNSKDRLHAPTHARPYTRASFSHLHFFIYRQEPDAAYRNDIAPHYISGATPKSGINSSPYF